MRKRVIVIGVCALALLAVGSNPHYLEELRIGGGYGEPVDGGADFDRAGNIVTDGSVTAEGGSVEAGRDSSVRGVMTGWDGSGGNAPGCLKLGSANGTVGYLFVSNDRAGLRIHSALPTSDTDGTWLKAQTVADLSAPPAIGGTTPNTGKFTSLDVTGTARVASGELIGSATLSPEAALHVRSGDSGFTGSRNWRIATGMLLEHSDDVILELQSPATKNTEIWFGDAASETAGRVRYEHATDSMHFYVSDQDRVSISAGGDVECAGDIMAKKGGVTAGTYNSLRGMVVAYSGANGSAPGTILLASPNGTLYYLFVEDDGTFKVDTALPTSNANGTEVGAQFSSTIWTFSSDDLSPDVSTGLIFKVPGTWTSGHDITFFDNAEQGQAIVIIGGDSDCVVVDGGNLKLAGNWTAAPGNTLSLVFDGADWFETARSDN
jgi:hypothetical protein